MNAKFTYSGDPMMPTQVAFCCWPVTGFSASESMVKAAHHCVAEQLVPPGSWNGTQPGG